jgi:hypothetical protein
MRFAQLPGRFGDCAVCFEPTTLAIASIAATVIGAGVGAVGAVQSGHAAQASADYSAQVAKNNATIADQNAQVAASAGVAQAGREQMAQSQRMGAIRAALASTGTDVGSGSALDVQTGQRTVDELDTMTVRNNAARTQYGYRTAAMSDTAQAGLDTMQGRNAAAAGGIGAVSSILGGASSVGKQYSDFLKVGAI